MILHKLIFILIILLVVLIILPTGNFVKTIPWLFGLKENISSRLLEVQNFGENLFDKTSQTTNNAMERIQYAWDTINNSYDTLIFNIKEKIQALEDLMNAFNRLTDTDIQEP